ncbi:MAG: bifunctional UDP-sugar hydrolase/5'-nucleotidase [Planctomycetota bacterium]
MRPNPELNVRSRVALWSTWVGSALALAGLALAAGQASLTTPGDGARQGPQTASAPELRHLVVFHTNDIHGQVLPRPATWLKDVDPLPDSGGLPRLAATLRRERAEAEADGAAVLVVDGGDWFQGTPEGNLDQGRGFLAALAAAGHDALVVGNHDFDHGVEVLTGHLAAVGLPALLANVHDAAGAPVPGTRDALVFERLGLRIAVVGLLTPVTPDITHASTRELTFEDPVQALTRVRAALGERVDWILPVCHLGVENERALAAALPWLDVVVGGHSHTYLRKGVDEGATLVVQAGDKASVLGRVDVWFDADGHVVKKSARLIDLYEEPAAEFRNASVDALCQALAGRAAASMDEVVGTLTAPLEQSRRPLVNTTAGNFITDLMRARTGADCAVHNRGGIRTALPAGPVTRRDLFMILPFANHLATLELDGATLIEIMRRSVEDADARPLEFSGMTLVVRMEEGQPRFVELRIGGAVCEPAKRYRMTTNSFLADGNDGLKELASASPRELDFILLRDLLEQAFAGQALTPANDQRYEVQR